MLLVHKIASWVERWRQSCCLENLLPNSQQPWHSMVQTYKRTGRQAAWLTDRDLDRQTPDHKRSFAQGSTLTSKTGLPSAPLLLPTLEHHHLPVPQGGLRQGATRCCWPCIVTATLPMRLDHCRQETRHFPHRWHICTSNVKLKFKQNVFGARKQVVSHIVGICCYSMERQTVSRGANRQGIRLPDTIWEVHYQVGGKQHARHVSDDSTSADALQSSFQSKAKDTNNVHGKPCEHAANPHMQS